MAPWTIDQVKDLFSSGTSWFPRSPEADYVKFVDDLNRGLLTVSRFEYTPSHEPEIDWSDESRYSNPVYLAWLDSGRGSGGERHGLLKWWGWNWLRSLGDPEPKLEQRYELGTADIVSYFARLVVECGDTSPERVLPALKTGRWDGFAVIPYPYWRNELGRVDHSGWIFRLGTSKPE